MSLAGCSMYKRWSKLSQNVNYMRRLGARGNDEISGHFCVCSGERAHNSKRKTQKAMLTCVRWRELISQYQRWEPPLKLVSHIVATVRNSKHMFGRARAQFKTQNSKGNVKLCEIARAHIIFQFANTDESHCLVSLCCVQRPCVGE